MQNLFRSIILLDKPSGPTSLECAERIRRIFSAKKAGHAGTLDPGVTGVLIIALDEATKAMPVLMDLEKEYEGVMHIHRDFLKSELREAIKSFTGRIVQTPPVKSAVSRTPRERDIYSFEITGISGRDASFRVRCQAGTYVRKLCSDIGVKMGSGAHMKSLRRIMAGPFSIEECSTFQKIEKNPSAYLMPIETALKRAGMKKMVLRESSVARILNGSPVIVSDAERIGRGIGNGEIIGIFSKKKIIALAVSSMEERKIGGPGTTIAKIQRIFR